MNLVHISDLHLGGLLKEDNTAKVIILLKTALAKGFDHLVITGDITDDGDEESFLLFRNILKNFNLLDPVKTTIIVGNHDIFGGVQTALDVLNFPKKCSAVDYTKKLNLFVSHFAELFTNSFFPSMNHFFPFLKIIKDCAIIGVNSIDQYSKLKNPFASNGRISPREFNDIKKILDREEIKQKKKVVLVHHHFYKNNIEVSSSTNSIWNKIESFTLKLRGKKKLIKMFSEKNVELVLHGHSHEIKEYKRRGIKFINAGAAVDNNDPSTVKLITVNISEAFRTSIEKISIKQNPENKTSEIRLRKIEAAGSYTY